MALIHFLKPKNQLEEGGRTAAPVQQDEGEPEKNCPNCHKDIPLSRLWANDLVCPCGYHFRMKARQRIKMIADRDSFHELYADMKSGNPLHFPGYKDKAETVRTASGEEEAVICGVAEIGGERCCLFVMESYFMMGSMGTAVGEKITSLFKYAAQHRLPVVGFTVSGGARMQEGLLSLMQMAKTSAAAFTTPATRHMWMKTVFTGSTAGLTTLSKPAASAWVRMRSRMCSWSTRLSWNAASSACPMTLRGQAIKAIIVLGQGYAPSKELELEIKDFCNQKLAEYKWIRLIEFAEEMPKTISGKIQKNVQRSQG